LRGIGARQRDLIEDVVNEGLSLYPPSALEKDLHLSFILERLNSGQLELPGLVLCGGTSLVKGHKLIARMSEDMDFKVIVDSDVSKNRRSLFFSGLKRKITSLLADEGFVVERVSAHNRNSFFSIELGYSPAFPVEAALRPHILLEFTAESPFLPPVVCRTTSLLGLAVSEELHSVSLPCLNVAETVAEKSVAFLRRSRNRDSLPGESRDKRLVRHVYDIGSIGANAPELSALEAAFVNAARRDSAKYATQDPEFANNPKMELARALNNLDTSVLRADYEVFVESLVAEPALGFDQAFEQFLSLARKLLR
jgi:predicted nucleotidyltransferase component of viral defense system